MTACMSQPMKAAKLGEIAGHERRRRGCIT